MNLGLFYFLFSLCFNLAVASDLDSEIEDAKLRVASGSKSKWSGSFNLNYSGASVHKPLDDERPQIGTFSVPDPVSAAGNFGFRYRLNKNKSLYMATGFYRAQPFSGRGRHEKVVEVSTPSVGLNNTFLFKDIQIGSSFTTYFTTLKASRDIGELATLGYNLNALKSVFSSSFLAGLNFYTWYTHYKSGYSRFESYQIDYGVSLGPHLQYSISESVNLYTSVSLLTYHHFKSDSAWNFEKSDITQTLGLGWAAQRDLYISPYISFEPEDIRSKNVNINLSVSINVL